MAENENGVLTEATPAIATPDQQAPLVPGLSAPVAEAAPTGKVDESFNFEAFNDDFDKGETDSDPDETTNFDQELTEKPVAPVQKAVVPPVAEPLKAEPVTPVPPVAEPEKPVEPVVPKPEVVVPTPIQHTPAQIAEERQRITEQYEKSYAMTEDEGAELIRNPEKVLPKLAATMHVQVMETTMMLVQQMLPQLLERELTVLNQAQAAKKQFFDAWPDLNKPEYNDQLIRVANTYRKNNPGASVEQYIQEVGAMASVMLRVIPKAMLQQASPAPVTQQQVFTPAGPGAGGVTITPKKPLNEFETMAVEFLDSDRS